MRRHKVARRACQIVVAAFQLLQVVIVNQALLPEVLEEVEVWPRRAQVLAERKVLVRKMVHSKLPRF